MANEVQVEITLEEKQALQALAKLTKATEDFSDKTVKSTKKANDAFSVFVGNLAAKGVAKGIEILSSAAANAGRNFLAFEKGIAEINTLLPKNAKLTKQNADAFVELSNQYGQDLNSQTKAFYDIVSAGVTDTSDAFDLLAVSNEAAIAGLTETSVAADALTSIVNSYSSAGLTAQQASDILFTTVRLGKTRFDELATSIGQVAPLANSAGVTFKDVGNSLAFLTANGLSTAEATTGLRAIISSVIKPSEGASKAAKRLGIDFSTSAIKAKGFAAFISEVSKATNGSETELAKFFPNVRALGSVIQIAGGNLDRFNQQLGEFEKSAGATSRAAEELKGVFDFKFDRLSTSFTNFFTQLADETATIFEPAINATLTGLTAVFDFLSTSEKDTKPAERGLSAVTERIKELEEEITKTEGVIKRASEEEGFFAWFDRANGVVEANQKKVSEYRKEIEGLREQQAQLEKDAPSVADIRRGDDSSTPDAPEPVPVEEDPKVIREKLVNAEIDRLREERALIEEEKAIALREAEGAATQEDLARLQEIEMQKTNLNVKAIDSRSKLLQSKEKDGLQRKKIAAKAELDIAKSKSDAEIKIAAGISLAKEGSEAQKALQLTSAIISTYTAATQAYSNPPGPPFTIPLAASVVAMGLSNVARITNAKFADGGFVDSPSKVGDTNTISVNGDEFIANRSQQRNLLSAVAQGQSFNNQGMNEEQVMAIANRPVVVEIDGREIAVATRDQMKEGFAV
jgi:TP901 family phage tail tape measure protein